MQFNGTHECIEVPRRQHRVLLGVERSLLHGRQLSRTFLQWTGNLARCYPFFQWHVCIVILPKGLVLIQVTTGFCQIATGLEGSRPIWSRLPCQELFESYPGHTGTSTNLLPDKWRIRRVDQ